MGKGSEYQDYSPDQSRSFQEHLHEYPRVAAPSIAESLALHPYPALLLYLGLSQGRPGTASNCKPSWVRGGCSRTQYPVQSGNPGSSPGKLGLPFSTHRFPKPCSRRSTLRPNWPCYAGCLERVVPARMSWVLMSSGRELSQTV
jgi:hypothetical protein